MRKVELLSPAGDMNKLKTAFHFGADAVYLAGKQYGLRAFAGNFFSEELSEAVSFAHGLNKKVYVTVNIFAQNEDFGYLNDYLRFLEYCKADGIIVTDPGIIAAAKKAAPLLDIHLSTQANTTNKYAVEFWRDAGIKRVVLARELTLGAIAETAEWLDGAVQLEVFVHGAMCISYSGRCLLSSYLSERDGNRGECVQACRWRYKLTEFSRPDNSLTLEEDESGSYILNSKDLCALPFLDKVIAAGVDSLKIEGRMKSEYYVAAVTNAYRKRLDAPCGEAYDPTLMDELLKVSHREYTDGFYFKNQASVCYNTSKPANTYEFAARVTGFDEERGMLIAEQRNRFYRGDTLEILSPRMSGTLTADEIYDADGNEVDDCKLVQQRLFIRSPVRLEANDILRKKKEIL